MHDNFKIDSEYGVDIDSLWTEENIKRNDIYEKEQIKKIMSLNLVFNSPFFGKIEYCDQFGNEKIYIGLRGIQKENHLFVVDWRTPVCSLYYHAKLGKTFYYVNRKEVNVDLKTKRQFDIDNGRLVGYLDSDRKVNDELLVKILSNNTNHYMKNIVKTIQEEQDEVIRQDLETNIIVNGVAGSGKTSIAMHRIAYLLFDNRDILSNENIIFISPNNLFSKYIAHLLPELGEKNIYAFSLFDILKNKKIITFKHEERPEMINKILNGDKDRLAQYNIKFSFEYLKKLKQYMSEVLNQNMLYELKIFSKDIIDKSFYIGERPYEIFDRICLISERLSESLNLSKGKTISLKNKIINLLLKKIKIEDIYYNFMKIMKLDSNLFNWDNIPTYAFIKICCLGFEKDSSIKHIVIDEMQDYDSVSFFVIKMLYKNATLTILGDYNQNLMCNESNLSCIEKIFSNLKLVELKTSYRSSSNIIEFANSILKKNIAKNHFRKGKVPVITESKNEQDMLKKINYQIEISIKNNQKLAILVKTKEQATKLQKKLTNGTLIVSDTNSVQIENMVIISTIFLCKGLEFDNVIIPYLTEENYKTTIDKYNLYVAITRALHSVEGFYYQNPSPLIDKKYINFLKS